jgi:hypothetical protein
MIQDLTGRSDMTIQKIEYDFYSKYPVYIIDNFFDRRTCADLIKQFDAQEQYVVGVDGYGDPEANIGSYRAMGWSEFVASKITENLRYVIQEKKFTMPFLEDGIDPISCGKPFALSFHPHDVGNGMELLGSTPWLRFMKYKSGGMHTPHHDAPFRNEEEQYITLFSWVLYLNTPNGKGGHFQFVNDLKQKGKHPFLWNTSDWTNMSNDVTLDVAPVEARMLIFPHWLCHQVQQYVGEGYRYIIRGDVAYGF